MPKATIHIGDCLQVLRTLPDNSVDACVTDPPYHLTAVSRNGSHRSNNPDNPYGRHKTGGEAARGFMGKTWDGGDVAFRPETWAEVLRVSKPGGHLLAFSGSRTYHRMACAVEDAGFEIRDQIMWIYGSGFPKSLDVSKAIDKEAGAERDVVGRSPYAARRPNPMGGTVYEYNEQGYDISANLNITAPATDAAKQWQGWGTALKPSHEPLVLARKPFPGTVAGNVLEFGTGALNIDGCRVPGDEDGSRNRPPSRLGSDRTYAQDDWTINAIVERNDTTGLGRWPANIVHDGSDEVLDTFGLYGEKTSGLLRAGTHRADQDSTCYGAFRGHAVKADTYGDSGSAARFFYCSKASNSERGHGNDHPTVKPISLMAWLVRLITPPGGTVIDPFTGSGSTGVAALAQGFGFIGCEMQEKYARIAADRIQQDAPMFNEVAIVRPRNNGPSDSLNRVVR